MYSVNTHSHTLAFARKAHAYASDTEHYELNIRSTGSVARTAPNEIIETTENIYVLNFVDRFCALVRFIFRKV